MSDLKRVRDNRGQIGEVLEVQGSFARVRFYDGSEADPTDIMFPVYELIIPTSELKYIDSDGLESEGE